MSYVKLPVRTPDDLNTSADINQLMENCRSLSGNGDLPPDKTITELLAYINSMMCIIQMIQNHFTQAYTYDYTTVRASAVELACLTTSITTKKSNTRIAFDALISGEIFQDTTFILFRDVAGTLTEIGSPSPSARQYGIMAASYDPDNASTMNQNKIQYIDSPNVIAGTTITYRIKVYGTATTAYINRTVTDSMSAASYERATSNVRLMEIV